MAETWKQIVYKGDAYRHEISSEGRVRHTDSGRIRKKHEHVRNGYNFVVLRAEGFLTVRVAILVANAFLRNREPGEQIDHINGIKTDDRAVNLSLVDQRTNIRRSYAMGNRKLKPEITRECYNFSEEAYDRIKEIWATGEYSQVQIAKMFDCTNSTISKIVRDLSQPRMIKDKTKLANPQPDFSQGTKREPIAKLKPDEVLKIYRSFISQTELAEQYGVSTASISNIKKGYTWRSLTGHPRPNREPAVRKILTPNDVRKIRKSKLPNPELAEKFGVHKSTIARIKTRVLHADVT